MCANKSYPIVNGSFIQCDMVYTWDDKMWTNEFDYLKEVNIDYLVLMGASNTEGNTIKTVYPTKISGAVMKYDGIDVLDSLLRNAEKADIKVFLGINFNNDWWKKYAYDPSWLYAQMEKGNLIADEVFNLYHSKYPNAFYGWYWMYEVNNFNFIAEEQLKVLAKAININLKHLTEKNERLPVLLSPYMQSNFSTPELNARNWEYIFKNTLLRQGDIFCPQDSIGSGGLNIDKLDKWFSALRKAIAAKPGLLFWANNENFIESDWSSATLDRFLKQLQLTNPYVTNHLTFSYSHYYSPNNINYGFHKTYLHYVNTGSLDKICPTTPKNLKLNVVNKYKVLLTPQKVNESKVQLTWKESKDNIGIYGYEVYRDGNLIYINKRQRIYGAVNGDISTEYIDNLLLTSTIKKHVYKVRAFDFAGNFSDFSKESEIEINLKLCDWLKNLFKSIIQIFNKKL